MPQLILKSLTLSTPRGCVGVCSASPEDREHPNKMPFTGTLLVVDQASNKPPAGAEAHRIFVPKAVAERRLKTLIGTGLNYDKELDGHAVRHKVGVITGAWLDGNKVRVSGFVWKKDFPEAERDLKAKGLGMSMELSDVYVRDREADVWYLEDFHFSGATVLYKDAAAYHQTALAAAAATRSAERGDAMKDKVNGKPAAGAGGDDARNPTLKAEALIRSIAASVAPAVTNALKEPLGAIVKALEAQAETNKQVLESIQGLTATQFAVATEELAAAGADDSEEEDSAEEEDSEDEEDEVDEEEMESEAVDAEEDVDAEIDTLTPQMAVDEQEPGKMGRGAKGKGSKTAVSASKAKKPALSTIVASAVPIIRTLQASIRREREQSVKIRRENARLKGRVETIQAQLDEFADRVDRQTIPSDVRNLLAKGGYEAADIQASGEKLTVAQVDAILKQIPGMDIVSRMTLKNKMLVSGVMADSGANLPS